MRRRACVFIRLGKFGEHLIHVSGVDLVFLRAVIFDFFVNAVDKILVHSVHLPRIDCSDN